MISNEYLWVSNRVSKRQKRPWAIVSLGSLTDTTGILLRSTPSALRAPLTQRLIGRDEGCLLNLAEVSLTIVLSFLRRIAKMRSVHHL